MDDALLDVVLERLDKVPLDQIAERLLMAACDSDASLAAELLGQGQGEVERRVGPRAEPAGAYLRSITVGGFRGIGPEASLELEPGPGLTLVVGRNGSGKSSFAEGLEVLLTGNLRRWERHPAWRAGWRSLHEQGSARLAAGVVIEDAGPAVVERTWKPDAAFTESQATVQVAAERRAGIERLGWQEALVSYRPFLSHSELEAFFSEPSKLYELLFSVLGLDDLVAADRRLVDARKERENGLKQVRQDLPALLDRLDAVPDERAKSCRTALAGRASDLTFALSVAAGSAATQPGGDISRLRQLTQLSIPPAEQVDLVATGLRDAADALEAIAGTQADQAMALAELLTSALEVYHAHGPGACPVCGTAGAMDEGWRAQAEQQAARLEEQAEQAHQAHEMAATAKAQAGRMMVQDVPAALSGPPIGGVDPAPTAQAWADWRKYPDGAGPEGLRRVAGHIASSWRVLSEAVGQLASAAVAELAAREDRWAPVARDVAAWCKRAEDAETAAAAVPMLKKAITWLKNANDDIRNDRLAPIGDQARGIWGRLRQESNVDLGSIRLSGSNTQRKLDVNVTVDGTPGSALGVMSQGEINALALSIFLPRATIAASPFRFLVIDDPVQAMDPAKVEGLARVLEEVSRSRQVIVFTHDDRLPDAVRRLGIAGRILEVTRKRDSLVNIRPALTPVEQQLKDAQDLCADQVLPAEVAAKVVPGMCRLAVEAAFTEAVRRSQLRAGKRHAEVEAEIAAANTFTKKGALAMFGNAAKGADVLPRLDNWRRSAADTFRSLNEGSHGGYSGSLRSLVSDTRALTALIREKLR
jgi:recombinational DNA repair ATPase RecF